MLHSHLRSPLFVLALFSCAACSQKPDTVAKANEPVKSTPDWSMPDEADIIHMTWANGPPQIQANRPYDKHLAGYRDERALLAFRSQKWGMLLDPRGLRLMGITLQPNKSIESELLDFQALTEKWDDGSLNLDATLGGKIFRAKGGAISHTLSARYQSPIHIVESGPWFQHVAIYDLQLIAGDGSILPGKSWLEIRAWGDRCRFQWFVEPEVKSDSLRLSMSITSPGLDLDFSEVSDGCVVELDIDFPGGAATLAPAKSVPPVKITMSTDDPLTRGQPEIKYLAHSDSWEVHLPEQIWLSAANAAYNPGYLDRISKFDLQIENTSDETVDVLMRIIHGWHPVTGYVPMMLDADEQQTGLPIQNSKNWHLDSERRHPYDGEWRHASLRFKLAPHTEVDWQYIIAHAKWQGLPASSMAQLSLVGYGFNGFWTQFALGSWGEIFCLQAGRSMRRSFITDVRPFMVNGRKTVKPYNWTTNVGGGDIGKIIDSDGLLVQWVGAVQEYLLSGPNLSHFRIRERSADSRLRLQIDAYLPRSNSITRFYFKIRLEALEDFAFEDLILFEVGNDYYNVVDSSRICWGNVDGLVHSKRPEAAQWARVVEPILLAGSNPWVSLNDSQRTGESAEAATRSLVVRAFDARLGGTLYSQPYLASSRTDGKLNAEVVLPDGIDHLRADDYVELIVEWLVHPIQAESYNGPNEELRARLASSSNESGWSLAHFEVLNQKLILNGAPTVFPATYVATNTPGQTLTVVSSSSLDTLLIVGLPRPDTWEIGELLDGNLLKLGERFPVESEPQISYDPLSESWTAVLSLTFPEGAQRRVFTLQLN